MVTHLGTNPAQCRVTSWMQPKLLLLGQAANQKSGFNLFFHYFGMTRRAFKMQKPTAKILSWGYGLNWTKDKKQATSCNRKMIMKLYKALTTNISCSSSHEMWSSSSLWRAVTISLGLTIKYMPSSGRHSINHQTTFQLSSSRNMTQLWAVKEI